MMALTPGAQIDELRRVLRESEKRRQVAEIKLADRERRLGTACQTIAAQDHRIGWLMTELARLRGGARRRQPCIEPSVSRRLADPPSVRHLS